MGYYSATDARPVMGCSHLQWVDVSKGIVISLMVLGHTSIPKWLGDWIWSFHMPFFFIISALFTSWDKGTFFNFFIRRSKLLLIPFVVYSLINFAILPPIYGDTYTEFGIELLMSGWGGIALWFVPVFYLGVLVTKLTSSPLIAIVGLLGSVILSSQHIELPWSLSVVPFVVFLMIIIKNYRWKIRSSLANLSYVSLSSVFLCGMFVSLLISHFWRLDMCTNYILPVSMILIGIVAGCSMIITGSILLTVFFRRLSRLFAVIGKNTYEIMALSQVIIMCANFYFDIPSIGKYLLMIGLLVLVIKLRKWIEGRFANIEVI